MGVMGVTKTSTELKKLAKEYLNEDEETREKDIEALREWLKKQPHLICRTDDSFLLAFLRGGKFSLEKAKEKLDMHLTIKGALPEFYTGWDPANNEIQRILDCGPNLYLPEYDHKGRKVIIVRPGACDPTVFDPVLIHRAGFMSGVAMMEGDDQAMICGIIVIFDAAGMGMNHITAMPLSLSRKLNKCWQDGVPLMPKQFHQINFPPMILSFFNTAAQFMKEKLRKRVMMHADYESLYKEVPKSILPKEYGGDGPTMQELAQQCKAKVMECREHLIEQEKYKANESKRPGKPRTSEDLFGIDGSFRKLNID